MKGSFFSDRDMSAYLMCSSDFSRLSTAALNPHPGAGGASRKPLLRFSGYRLVLLRRRTMYRSVFLLRRVFLPSVGLPHGLFGLEIPMGWRPSPPPCGWSRGLIAEPRTVGRIPLWRFRPALPSLIFP